MAGSFTDFLERAALDHLFGGPTYTRPDTVFIGLSTTAIDDDGSGITEPDTDDGYERVEIDNDGVDTLWTDAVTDGGETRKTNNEPISFPEATGDWGEVTHFFIADSQVGGSGEILAYGNLTVPKTIGEADTASFDEGDLLIRLD